MPKRWSKLRKRVKAIVDPRNTELRKNVSGLRKQQTFESFVLGPSNQLALVAAQIVSENPGKNYNPPLYLRRSGIG